MLDRYTTGPRKQQYIGYERGCPTWGPGYARGTGVGASMGMPATGRPASYMDFESANISGRPCDSSGCARPERESVVVALPGWLQTREVSKVRTIGLDVHKRFAEVAILEPGRPLRRKRILTTPAELRAFVDELGPEDQVVLEATFNTWQLTELLRSRAGRVVVSNPMKTKAIASAKVKTDKVDAEILARLLAADFLAEVWIPDAPLRALRRQLSHRLSLVRQRTQFRNRIHAVIGRNLLDCLTPISLEKLASVGWPSSACLRMNERWSTAPSAC